VQGKSLSPEFKDFILALFSYDPAKRPSISQLRAHSWMNKTGFSMETTRQQILNNFSVKHANIQTKQQTKPVQVKKVYH
jgi:serine/threonine protein kinase